MGSPHERHTLRGFTATHLFPLKTHMYWTPFMTKKKGGRPERSVGVLSGWKGRPPPHLSPCGLWNRISLLPIFLFCLPKRTTHQLHSLKWCQSSTLSFRGCLKRLTNTALLAMARRQSDHKARRSKLRCRERNGTEHTNETQRWI